MPAQRSTKARSAAAAAVPLSAVVVLFVVSGAAGLIYEVIWLRSLTLIFGKTVHAASAVLAAFMAGLALGALAGGRLVDRSRVEPLRLYALLEAGIGVWALVLPVVFAGIHALYASMARPFDSLPPWLNVVRFLMATLALMPATALMGATLPALSRWAVRHESQVGSRLGLLYALNTLGGVAGTLAAGFVLLEWLGVTRSTLVAVAGNFIVAAIAFALARRKSRPAGAGTRADAGAGPALTAPAAGWRLAAAMLAVFLGGLGALALEVTWTRTLQLVFGSTTYSFTAMLAVFLFGIGSGSLIMTPFADRLRRPWMALGLLQAGIGIMVLVSVRAIDVLPRTYLTIMSWGGISFGWDLAAKFMLSGALMLLPTMLSGAVWPVAVRLVRPQQATLGGEVGRLYAANTVGSIAGSLAGAFVLLPWLGMQHTLMALGVLIAAFGALFALLEPAPLARRAAVAIGALLLTGGLALTQRPWDRELLTSGAFFMPKGFIDEEGHIELESHLADTRLVYYAEGVTTTPSVAILGDVNKAFFNDGKIEGATAIDGMRLQRLLGHLPLLLHRGEPQVALNIGLGSGITVGAMGVHPVPRIDCAEIEPVVLGAARMFDRETFSILSRAGLRILFNDGRNHLMLTSQQYDVFSSMPFAPMVGGSSALYSLEHFRLVRDRLAPGGMASQYVPLYQIAPVDFRSIIRTFAEVFPDATAWYTGVEMVLLGTDAPLQIDFGRLAARMREPRVAESLAAIGMEDPMRLLSTYSFRVADIARDLQDAPINTDDRPRLEYTSPRNHLVNTVRDNLPWILQRKSSPAPLLRFPVEWAEDDPRREQLRNRLEIALEARRLTMEGRLQVLRGDLEGGIATLERAVARDPSDIYARDLAARNLAKLAGRASDAGRTAEAVADYERALRWHPDHFLSLYNLAIFYFEQGRHAEARDLTERALALAPDSPAIHYRMGLLNYIEGRWPAAERHLTAALAVDPNYPEPLMVLGDLRRSRGRPAEAAAMYEQAIRLGKKDHESYAALAQALLDQGRRDESARYVRMALELAPQDPEAIYTRARLEAAAGRREQAARDLAQAVAAGGESYRRRAMDDPDLRPLLN